MVALVTQKVIQLIVGITAAQFTSPSSSLASVFATAVCDCLKPMPDCLAGFKINAVNNINQRFAERLLSGEEQQQEQQPSG